LVEEDARIERRIDHRNAEHGTPATRARNTSIHADVSTRIEPTSTTGGDNLVLRDPLARARAAILPGGPE
jgi:hypothetical protein